MPDPFFAFCVVRSACAAPIVHRLCENLTDLINALPGNSSVNTVQHTIEEAVFSVDPTNGLID
jgi:hypothetical protein